MVRTAKAPVRQYSTDDRVSVLPGRGNRVSRIVKTTRDSVDVDFL
nr:hypothetical protein [Kibdelosporangium sp. MJ126-NF4]CTQ98765.1 hypothetical protein [Kibdelosporangium sp. MJ126-NF4]